MAQLSQKELDEIQAVLKSKIEDEFTRAMSSYQGTLDEMQKAGIAANDKRVQDLEKRLSEAEKKHEENLGATIAAHKNEIRQLEGQIAVAKNTAEIISVGARPGERGYMPDYKGCFIRDVAKMREFVRSQSGYYGNGAQVRVSDLTSAMLTAGSDQGLLPPDVADTFIDNLISQQAALSRVTVRRMNSPQAHLDELVVAARKLAAAQEATAPSNTQAFSARRRTLDTLEYIWTEDITLSFLEDNIEKRNAEAHVAQMIATQFGNDLNDLGWNGDLDDGGGEKAFLNLNDGWHLLATDGTGEVTYTATNDQSATATLAGMLKVLPVNLLGRTDVGYFMPIPFCQHYANEMSVRETAQGDSVLINGFPALRFFGRPVIPDPHLSSANSSNAKGMLTAFPNLVFGIQRQITVDSMWQPRKRVIEYTVTARVDYQIATIQNVVQTLTIPAALQ